MKTTIRGEIKAAPDTVSESSLPNGVSIAEFSSSKNHPVQTGLVVRDVSSAGSFVALEGPGTTIEEVGSLYFRSNNPVEVELTQAATARVVQSHGILVVEFDQANPLTLLRVKGIAKIEYFVSGIK